MPSIVHWVELVGASWRQPCSAWEEAKTQKHIIKTIEDIISLFSFKEIDMQKCGIAYLKFEIPSIAEMSQQFLNESKLFRH